MYKIKDINKSFKDLKVLKDISIDFPINKTICILGPSGCGKTTLINILLGTTGKDSGEIIGFQEDVSVVFQEDRLIPWKNIKDNIKFVLKGKVEKEEIENIIDEYFKLVNLQEYKYYYPKNLSGGMRQKINILRAFLYPSNVLIMDEPFKSLDINSKGVLINFFKDLRTIENKTCIIVTHDIDEAISLCHRMVILTDKPTRVRTVIDLEEVKDKTGLRKLIEEELIIKK